MNKKLVLLLCFIFSLCTLIACGAPTDSSTGVSSNSESTQVSDNSTETSTSVSSTSVADLAATAVTFQEPRRTLFVQDEELSAIAYATVTYTDGSSKTFYDGSCYSIITNYDKNVPGVYVVSLKVGNLEPYTYEVTIVPKPVVNNNVAKFRVDSAYNGAFAALDSENYSQFKSLSDAFQFISLSKLSDTISKEIYLQAGVYEEKLNINVKNLSIIGIDAATTKITYGDCSGKVGGTDSSASVIIKGEGFIAKNITFENSFDYNGDKQYGDNKQATAVLVDTDKVYFENCVFLGYQDTLQAKRGRQYYKNCTIKGCVDYIFGNNATALFDNCDIVTLKRADNEEYCITAHKGNNGDSGSGATQIPAYGYVFMNCSLTCEQGVTASSTALGRPWRANATVAYINCEMGEHISTKAFGESGITRYRSMSGGGATNIPENAHFYEFGNTGLGAVSAQLNNDFTMLTNADNYTASNIFATTNGGVTYTGEWNPVS